MARSARSYWWYWFLVGLPLLAGGAGGAAFWFQEGLWPPPWLNQTLTSTSDFETGRLAERADKLEREEARRTPYLSFQNSKAAINQPLELGIVLNNGTGAEILVLSGFSEGTRFSAGAALSATRWSLPGPDTDKAFISAPENFSGTMQVTATLYSSAHEILETKVVRFEWSVPEEEERMAGTDLISGASSEPPDNGADDAERTRFSDAFGSVLSGKDASSATGGYSEPSTQGPRPMWLTMVADWLSQISSISLPPVDRPFERAIGFQPLLASTPATLVERGEHLLREGNVLAARPLLRGAADAGRADAAVALAMSFDPLYVPEGSPNGATANPAEAARWYRRGLKLGRRDIAADLERVTNLIKNTAPP